MPATALGKLVRAWATSQSGQNPARRQHTRWVTAQPVWVRVLLALVTAAFVYGVVVVVLHVLGVPSWAPGWVPLWR